MGVLPADGDNSNLAIEDGDVLSIGRELASTMTRKDWCFRIGSLLRIKAPLLDASDLKQFGIDPSELENQLDGRKCLSDKKLSSLVQHLGFPDLRSFLQEAMDTIPFSDDELADRIKSLPSIKDVH